MRSKILYGAFVAGLVALLYAFTAHRGLAGAAENKNLKVFPAETTKKDIKKAMKGMADGLGVQCDHCHDIDDMSKDTEKKDVARGMLKMTAEINKTMFKGKPRVKCLTCHNGKVKPK